jgi:SAM-dependent methyltransferase
MSADGLAGGGTTGGDGETARGRRGQRTGAQRGSSADASAREAPARQASARETSARGAPARGAPARETPARGTPARETPAQGTPAHETPAQGTPAHETPARDHSDADLFARYTRDYVSGREGQQITVLQAGCTTADGDLGIGTLRAAGADVAVSLIDDDQPATRAALSTDESMAGCVHGDLRTLPLPPRSHDIVLCVLLLQRIRNAELVLDRLVATIRPGGLLLLRFSDRDSAAGFLDRVMPAAARRAVWRKRRPAQPGPYEAVYERLSSARGVQAYALMRELVIAERRALGGLAGGMAEPYGFLAGQKLIAWLSRGRLTAAHEELLYVLRKPEDRFARVL